jgi:hypothetical protein
MRIFSWDNAYKIGLIISIVSFIYGFYAYVANGDILGIPIGCVSVGLFIICINNAP